MIKRLLGAWRSYRGTVGRAEAHLAKIVEQLAAAEERSRAWSDRIELHLAQLNKMEVNLARMEHHMTLAHPRFASPLRLERYGRQVFSQHDEDGIIAEIFRRIGATAQVFVEIAAGDGKENCSAFLLSQGWRGLWVECDAGNVQSIHNRWPQEIARGQLKVCQEFVKRDTVNDLIAQVDSDEIDILIMDIDGNDYHILDALTARPRVICAEYTGKKPPPVSWYMPYDEDFDLTIRFGAMAEGIEYGASLQAFEDLLTPRGYSLVGSSITGVNCFFVRSDLVDGKFQAPFTAQNHYNPVRYWYRTLNFMSQVWIGSAADGQQEAAPSARPSRTRS